MRIESNEPPGYGTPRMDKVGKIYIAVTVIFTALIAAGTAVLLYHRNLPFIRLKKVPLILTALVLLHLQFIFDMLQYPLNGSIPCSVDFWIMSICLPAGIAAFQTNNWVLFSRAWGQKHLLSLHSRQKGAMAEGRSEDLKLHGSFFARQWNKWRQLCILKKMYRLVAVGTALQVIGTLVIFLISKRFHADFGLIGAKATPFQCRAGWEWLLSGVWQAVWTYGVGPFILFKIRKINDTHYWRLQTTLAIIFSLPALPLWLSTWFTPHFYIMNAYWPPTMWFVPGIAAMEFIILFFPLIEIHSFKSLQKKAREEPGHSRFSKYSAAALDRALKHDIERLEDFAATKDLCGENILLLKTVARWKSKWQAAKSNGTPEGMEVAVQRELYAEAENIWKRLVSRDTANFPLNIEDNLYRELEMVFGYTNPGMRRQPSSDQIVPFADHFTFPDIHTKKGVSGIQDFHEMKAKKVLGMSILKASSPPTTPQTPSVGFCGEVFDRAEEAVRQMVLENTWVRFVDYEERRRGGIPQDYEPSPQRWRSIFWKKEVGC